MLLCGHKHIVEAAPGTTCRTAGPAPAAHQADLTESEGPSSPMISGEVRSYC